MSISILFGAALLWAAPPLPMAPAPPADCLTPIHGGELPERLEWSRDVRWAGEKSLYSSVRQQGVFEWSFAASAPNLWAQRGDGGKELPLPEFLAASGDKIVVGSPLFAFGYGSRGKTGLEAVIPFSEIADLDVQGSKVVVNGSRRDPRGHYAPEGAIAWIGSLGKDPAAWFPLHLSEKGPGVDSFSRCGRMNVGAVRFLGDGSIFFVPGVEGGAYLYDSAHKLIRAFTDQQLGIDSGCGLDEAQTDRYARDEAARWAWVNGRRVVDEILPLPDGRIGLVIRETKETKPHFELVSLSRDGDVRRCRLPIESRHEFARLKGDIRDGEILLIETQQGFRPRPATVTDLLTGATQELPAVLHPSQKTRYFVFRYQP